MTWAQKLASKSRPAVLWAVCAIAALDAIDLGRTVGIGGLPLWLATARSVGAIVLIPVLISLRIGRTRSTSADGNANPHVAVATTKEEVRSLLDAAEGMRMVFQPIQNLRSGTIVGYEALARFTDGRAPHLWFEDAHAVGLG